MTHKWTDMLSAYIDDELDSVDKPALEAHLNECAECQDTLKQLRGVVGWAQSYDGSEPANDVWPQVVGNIRETQRAVVDLNAMREERASRRRFSIPQIIAAGIAENMQNMADNERPNVYPSFHGMTSKGNDAIGDFVMEADCRGWRRSFVDVRGAIEILSEFHVPYIMKFSGHRSLHVMIPREAFPDEFDGASSAPVSHAGQIAAACRRCGRLTAVVAPGQSIPRPHTSQGRQWFS